MTTPKILLLAAALASSCSVAAATDSMRAPAPSSDVERSKYPSMPDICSLNEGRWCEPCGLAGLPVCPQGDSGPLCCSGDVCVVWTGGKCKDLGWCNNYTIEETSSGVEQATCHDVPGGPT